MRIIEETYAWAGEFTTRPMTDMIILHHAAAVTASAQDVHRWHLANGWIGIGYHYYVRKDGSIYRGRPEDAQGAHTSGYNTHSIGICAEGNFETEQMPLVQRDAIVWLVSDIMDRLGELELRRHRDCDATACPGRYYDFDYIKEAVSLTEAKIQAMIEAAKEPVYKTVDDIPEWGVATVQKLLNEDMLLGDGDGLNIPYTMLRMLVINDRAGMYDKGGLK